MALDRIDRRGDGDALHETHSTPGSAAGAAAHWGARPDLRVVDRRAPRALPTRATVPARLVLFVGAPPGDGVCDLLAQDGIRSLCLGGPTQALRAASMACFDALVIDAAQLGSRTAAWLARLRTALGCPMLVVAERADEIDEIVTLELGADAYLARPLAPRRLRAHLAALLRQSGGGAARAPSAAESALASPPRDDAPADDGPHVDRVAHRLHVAGQSIAVTDVQGALLQCLLDAGGRVVARASLAAVLPGGDTLSARCVDVYLHRLRQRLQAHPASAGMAIEAVRGRGYRLTTDRAVVAAPAEARPWC